MTNFVHRKTRSMLKFTLSAARATDSVSLSYFKDGSILRVIFTKKKGSILWVIFKKKRFNSLSRTQEKGFNSLCRIQRKRVKFWESYSKTFNSLSLFVLKMKGSVHRVIFSKKVSILWLIIGKKKRFQYFESYWKKINSLRHIQRKRVRKKGGSILWVVFKNLWVILKKGSVLWVVFFNSFKTRVNSLSHTQKKKVQFLKSN